MPSNVKTPHDEKLWSEAKAKVQKEYGTTNGNWSIVMYIYEKLKGK